MSTYLVLARKYRPRAFAEVVGQEVATRVLEGALSEGRIGHAYLFAGPRGTGKTTMARIFAKCLNCERGPSATPCGRCESCRAADDGSAVDIIELDAASHTGVDTIRELRDEVIYAPMQARHKVYIVDEVHMLSKPAFNALLKTLEEPPAHVVFLFATTEPHKVLETVLSRCQILRLAPLSEAQIAGRLEQVFGLEEVKPGAGLVQEIAREARGGMRDALSLADKLLALAGDEPTVEDLRRLGGDGGSAAVVGLLAPLEARDRRGVLEALGASGRDDAELCNALLEELRRSLVLLHCGEDAPWIQGTQEERRAAHGRAARLGPERLELWMQECLRARERMRLLPGQERAVLEVTLLDLCEPDASATLAELVARLEALEARAPERGAHGAPPGARGARGAPPGAPEPLPPPAPAARAALPSAPSGAAAGAGAGPSGATRGSADGGNVWQPFLAALAKSHGSLAALLERGGRMVAGPGPAGFTIAVAGASPAERVQLEDRRLRAGAQRILSQVLGRDAVLEIRLEGSPPAARADQAPPPPGPQATLVPEKPHAPEPGTRAKPAAPRPPDEFTREVADLFGGVIEDLS